MANMFESLSMDENITPEKARKSTKQRMFWVFAIDEILCYRGSHFPASRTLCHPGLIKYSDFRFPMSALLWAEWLSCCSLWYFSFVPSVQNWQPLDTVNYSLQKNVQKDKDKKRTKGIPSINYDKISGQKGWGSDITNFSSIELNDQLI